MAFRETNKASKIGLAHLRKSLVSDKMWESNENIEEQVQPKTKIEQNYGQSFNPIIDEDADEARLLNNMVGRPTSAPARLQTQSSRASRRGRGRASRRGRGRASRRGRGRASRRGRGRGRGQR
jgi:hypothetical protein